MENKELTVKQITSKINQTQKKIDEWTNCINQYQKWIGESKSESDVKRYKATIRQYEKKINKYEAQMAELKLLQKGKIKEYPILRQFVNKWKEYCISVISNPETIKTCIEAYEEMKEKCKKIEEEYKEKTLPSYSSYYEIESIKNDFMRSWRFIAEYMIWSKRTVDTERLEKDYAYFAEQKYNKFIEDCEYYVGEITDTSDLSIGDKGDINGHVIGVKAKANVNTISAEGPIQRFHYRTLIKVIA